MKTIEYRGYQVTSELSEETTQTIVDEAIRQRLLIHDRNAPLTAVKMLQLTINIIYSQNSLAINIID